MKGGKLIGFNASAIAKAMMAEAAAANTESLIDYAEKTIREIGDTIASYPSGKHMDNVGNLLDSLCWGVCYDGNMVASGFYRPQRAQKPSIMHERYNVEFKTPMPAMRGSRKVRSKWRYDDYDQYNWEEASGGEPVNGRQLAEEYLAKESRNAKTGKWKVFFAVLAPYWGYWEKGFTMKGRHSSTFAQFSVMTQFYDKVSSDLKPSRTTFKVHVPKYASKSLTRNAKKNLKDPQRFDKF